MEKQRSGRVYSISVVEEGDSDILYEYCMAGAKRNSSLPFRRGPDLSIYHIPTALLVPETSATFINLRALRPLFGHFHKPPGTSATSATFINLRPLRVSIADP